MTNLNGMFDTANEKRITKKNAFKVINFSVQNLSTMAKAIFGVREIDTLYRNAFARRKNNKKKMKKRFFFVYREHRQRENV